MEHSICHMDRKESPGDAGHTFKDSHGGGETKENEMYLNLANAIIIQAVDDYRRCLKKLNKKPYHQNALKEKHEIERFFRSEWYSCLTDVNPEKLIKNLNDEVAK